MTNPQSKDSPQEKSRLAISEDWQAVLIAFLLILLAALGVLGDGGLPIKF